MYIYIYIYIERERDTYIYIYIYTYNGEDYENTSPTPKIAGEFCGLEVEVQHCSSGAGLSEVHK